MKVASRNELLWEKVGIFASQIIKDPINFYGIRVHPTPSVGGCHDNSNPILTVDGAPESWSIHWNCNFKRLKLATRDGGENISYNALVAPMKQ